MRALPHARVMDDAPKIDIEALLIEIGRYLAAVDAFRDAGCEPRWRRERRPVPSSLEERST